MPENAKLNTLINTYFREEDRHSPTEATSLGLHQFDAELEDFSPAGIASMKNSLARFEKELAAIDFDTLDKDGQIRYHLLRERIRSSRRFFDVTRTLETDPALYASVAIQSVFLLLLRDFAPLEDRLTSAAERMKKMPYLFEAAKQNLQNPPEIYTGIAIEMMQGGLAFFAGLVPKMAEQAPGVKDKVLAARDIAMAACLDYGKFLAHEVKPRSTGDYAIGKDLLDTLLREKEFLDLTYDDLWEIGHRELEKCEQEVVEFVRREYKTDRPWREVFREMKKNHPPKDQVLETFTRYFKRAEQFVTDHDIIDIPANQRLLVMETPEFNRITLPHAALMPPATFDTDRTGFLWVTPVDSGQSPENQERQLMEYSYGKVQYLALHEAIPGHHLQLVYATSVPDELYKRTFSGIFIEGWAFYCEQMMKEMGYFDRDGHLAQLEAAYWRALRVLLDVGLHTKRFTFDEAMAFLQARVDWAPIIAMGELKRYTHQPTQALSYYTGKLEIFRIKEAYQKAKGEAFSLKEFHHDLLSHGSLPPKVLEWQLGIREIEKPGDVRQGCRI